MQGENMRVAYLAWESMHSIFVGGLSVVVTNLAEQMAKAGHEVHVFTRWMGGQSGYDYINNVHYHRCKFDPGPNLLAFAHNMSMSMVARLHEVERNYGKFDVVHGHDWHAIDALNELKNRGYPIVLTFHSTEYGRNGGNFGDWWEFREISGKEWYGGYIANRLIAVSNSLKNELMWLYKIPADKIEVIPNAIEPRICKLKVDPGMTKEKYGIHPLAPTVLFIGRMAHQKGPDLLLEAAPRVLSNRWDTRFLFAGEGGMRMWLGQRAHELGIAPATRFLGWLPYWSYLELLNSCDIVCIPSRNEPFGIVLLEAWAAGRPVVSTDVGGLGENIENFVDGIKVYPNPDSVAWGICYLLNSPEDMKRIAEAGRKKVEKYNWVNAIERLLNVYAAVGTES